MSLQKRIFVGLVIVATLVLVSQYMYVLPIHIAAFFVSIIGVVVADAHAFLWVLGKLPTLPQRRLERLHHLVSAGLLTAVTTGFLMFWPVRDYLLYETSFQIKVTFVAALIINSFVIARHMDVAFARSYRELSWAARWPLLLSGAVSTVSWAGTFIAAQFLGL